MVDNPMLTGVDTGEPALITCTVLEPVVPWIAVVGTRRTLVAVAVAIDRADDREVVRAQRDRRG